MIEKQIAYQRPLSIVEIVATLAKVSGAHVANAIAASQGCLSSSRKSSFAWAGGGAENGWAE